MAAFWRWRWAGLYHGYRQVRNRRVNEALVQGVETARAVLTTTPQGQAADAQFVKWLMEHQKEAGVFTTVSGLVDQLSDNPAAKMTAQEIAERVAEGSRRSVGGRCGDWRLTLPWCGWCVGMCGWMCGLFGASGSAPVASGREN